MTETQRSTLTSITAQRMIAAATTFLELLTSTQRVYAQLPFSGDERYQWAYTPGRRNGLALRSMNATQRKAALALLDAGLSAHGSATAQQIIALETILRETERIEQIHSNEDRDPSLYYFTIFGTPSGTIPWGWRANGHHLALHFTVVDAMLVASTPLFFGTNPAQVRHGAARGLRILAAEEDLARIFLGSLETQQKAHAIVAAVAPDDILTQNFRMVDASSVPQGISYAALSGVQRGHLLRLIRHYNERTADELSQQTWAQIERRGLDSLSFAWAGSEERGQGHYYAIKGPTFLIEYDNTQNHANHIHSVWRDLSRDWGNDLLAEHYAHDHHHST